MLDRYWHRWLQDLPKEKTQLEEILHNQLSSAWAKSQARWRNLDERARREVVQEIRKQLTELRSIPVASIRPEDNVASDQFEFADIPELSWTVLPPSEWETYLARLKPGIEQARPAREYGFDRGRWDFIFGLQPNEAYRGSHLDEPTYLVAVFDKVAIAEALREGNALYYCSPSQWRTLFRLTKQDARAAGARRIYHDTLGWKNRVRDLVKLGYVPEREWRREWRRGY
jgi:hypothetical protein